MTGPAARPDARPDALPDSDVAALHQARPGITEDLLARARDPSGRTPYDWLVAALPGSGTVLDLACGSAPIAPLVGLDRYLGIDRSAAELATARARRPGVRVVLGDVAGAGPAGSAGSAGSAAPYAAGTVSMALMLLDLRAVLRRVRPLLPAGAPLVAIVPTRSPGLADTDYGRLLGLLGQLSLPYPEPLDPSTLRPRLAAEGFALTSDQRADFARPVRSAADADLVVSSFYAVRSPPEAVAAARGFLLDRLDAGPFTLGYPIRRLVARRG